MTTYISLRIVKATTTPGSAPLIELKTNAATPELATTITDASINELAKPMIDEMLHDLAIARERLVSAGRELEAISNLVVNAGVKDDRLLNSL
jgi:hypothetical protein